MKMMNARGRWTKRPRWSGRLVLQQAMNFHESFPEQSFSFPFSRMGSVWGTSGGVKCPKVILSDFDMIPREGNTITMKLSLDMVKMMHSRPRDLWTLGSVEAIRFVANLGYQTI